MHDIQISAEALRTASNWAMEGENAAPVRLLVEGKILTVFQGDDMLIVGPEGRRMSPVSEALAIQEAAEADPDDKEDAVASTPGVCPHCGNRADDETTPHYFDNVEDKYTYCYACGQHATNPRHIKGEA